MSLVGTGGPLGVCALAQPLGVGSGYHVQSRWPPSNQNGVGNPHGCQGNPGSRRTTDPLLVTKLFISPSPLFAHSRRSLGTWQPS